MKLTFDPDRPQTEADRTALALIGEGFRRLREQKKNALDGAQSESCEPDCAYSASVNVGNHESGSQGFEQPK